MRREPLEEGAEDGVGLHNFYGIAVSMLHNGKSCNRDDLSWFVWFPSLIESV
jgi:hypothetical protein